MIHWDKLQETLIEVVGTFEKSAPTVSNWANDLFIRVSEDIDSIRVVEIMTAGRVMEFRHCPSQAANMVYKLKHRIGQDTTGDLGF